jgi:hypothetical protein
MSFPENKNLNVYVSADDSAASYVPVVGNITWEFTDEADGETSTRYMGGGELVRQSDKRNRSGSLGGLFDPDDTGQNQLRTAAGANTLIWVALVHDDTSGAEKGRKQQARVSTFGDSADADGSDAPRFTMSVKFQGALQTFAALP